jgi:hypothetical protein
VELYRCEFAEGVGHGVFGERPTGHSLGAAMALIMGVHQPVGIGSSRNSQCEISDLAQNAYESIK